MAEKCAYFAGGCFWCITPVFHMDGVHEVTSGYSGGTEINPEYEAVKHQKTGHRETIKICYDDAAISYDALLAAFLGNIDPFDDGGQFIDRGHSYTTAVYYCERMEKEAAETALERLAEKSGQTVCVAVEPFTAFYAAEDYHQDYYLKNPEAFEKEMIDSGRRAVLGDK